NLLWATLYGGTGSDGISVMDIDNSGNLFVAGGTNSPDFPLQNTGTFFQGTVNGQLDIFILKFDNAGNRLWATLYGGVEWEVANSLCIDNGGNIYLTGE